MFPMHPMHFSWLQDTHCFPPILFLLAVMVPSIIVNIQKVIWSQMSSKDTGVISAHQWQCRGCQWLCPMCGVYTQPPPTVPLPILRPSDHLERLKVQGLASHRPGLECQHCHYLPTRSLSILLRFYEPPYHVCQIGIKLF